MGDPFFLFFSEIFVLFSSFLRLSNKRCPDRAIDTHIYQAWRNPDSRIGFYTDACNQKGAIAAMEREFGPVVVGEWSLATDNCAMWLNGFNDNLAGFPRLPCKYIDCPDPYMGDGVQPGTPVDPNKPIQGPFGTGMSGPIYGQCPVGRDWLKESSGNPQTGHDWVKAPPQAPKRLDDTDNVMTHLAYKKINAFSGIGHGFYFWNFRTDVPEPKWSYLLALEKGWIPKGNLLYDDLIVHACDAEDAGAFVCVLKPQVQEQGLLDALSYIIGEMNRTGTLSDEDIAVFDKKGDEQIEQAGELVSQFFESHKSSGATCDFGGIAMLVEQNRTITDDDYIGWNDDEYQIIIYQGPNWWVMGGMMFLAVLLGSFVGFIVAMRVNKKFNKRVRESVLFRPLTNSKSSVVRKSLALPPISDFAELDALMEKDNE